MSTRHGAWLDSQGLCTRRTSLRASSPEATEVEECVGASRRLPAAWSNSSRWHTVIEDNFKFREANHVKEGRATLLCVRRAVAGTAGHGHRFLSFTDNMSSLLAFDRGRREAALCIAADGSWVLRHLETWRNPSDGGSRRAPGVGRARFMRSSAQPRAAQQVSGALGVQVRDNPEPADPAKPAPSRGLGATSCSPTRGPAPLAEVATVESGLVAAAKEEVQATTGSHVPSTHIAVKVRLS